MKTRKHTNNKGSIQIKRGRTTEFLKRLADRLNIKFEDNKIPVIKTRRDTTAPDEA